MNSGVSIVQTQEAYSACNPVNSEFIDIKKELCVNKIVNR